MTKGKSQSAVVIVAVAALVVLLGLMTRYPDFFGGVTVTGGVITSSDGLVQCDDGDSYEAEIASMTNIWEVSSVRDRFRGSISSPWSSWYIPITDGCSDEDTLFEGYCVAGLASSSGTEITCIHGCINGRCRLPPCTDSDAGLSPEMQARTRGETRGMSVTSSSFALGIFVSQTSRIHMDSCAGSRSVYEYSCSSNLNYGGYGSLPAGSPPNQQVERVVVSCPPAYSYCVDGRCVASASSAVSRPPPVTPSCTPFTETCDGRDNDCDGSVDEGCDDDNDNRCDSGMTRASPYSCTGTAQCCTAGGGDCNDLSASVRPGATEVCGNGVDEDCSGADLACPAAPSGEICDSIDNDRDNVIDESCDVDNDNYCATGRTIVGTPTTCTAVGLDCNDLSASIHPGATEVCGNGVDEDCSGADLACTPAPSVEICDNSDNNANGVTDEGCDDDNDNYCDPSMTRIGTPTTCTAGGGDCNDLSASVRPGATEVCDGGDNDCDSTVDESCDNDDDNYCDDDMTRASPYSCAGTIYCCPSGGGDCNDASASIHPGATEFCGNGVDENCDGVAASCPATTPTSPTCTDSDTANSRTAVGVVTSTDLTAATTTGGEVPGTPTAGGLYEYKDSCSGTTTLYQYSCIGTDVRRYDFACPPRLNPSEYGFCTTDATGGGYCPRCATTPSAAGCPSS